MYPTRPVDTNNQKTKWQWEEATRSSISPKDIKSHVEACSYATANS